MSRTIEGSKPDTKFAPTVRLEEEGAYVKGKIVATRDLPADSYGFTNRVISLELIDLEGGSTQETVAKGEYREVDVNVGDLVDFVGRGTDLREKIPQLKVGDVVTITSQGAVATKKGRQPKKLFSVVVED